MFNANLRSIIERKAKRLSSKMIDKLIADHKVEITRIRKRAEDDAEYFRKQDERREKIYLKRREYIDNKRARTEKECADMIEDAEIHADTIKAKARGLLIDAIRVNNKVQNSKVEIQSEIATLQGVSTQVAVQADQSDSAANEAENLLRRIK